ncbi:cyclase family protein [Halarchaeum nitratireducens]|uniref:Cyclase n=1 Tax=Halarchaeum nitratireducens TaxID=489913 RepID=A0A830G958_9EURY|nr:cyclase family protein [Halarchaeum nitratireducens]GGN09440.1 cyclase [Halarchaeum nitratireducens]
MKSIDLSHELRSEMPIYPGDPEVSVETAATNPEDGYHVCSLALGTHAGTHVDAPRHVDAAGPTLGDVPLDEFRLDARLAPVDAGAREAIGPDRLPDPDDADVLVVRTGWDAEWGTERYFDHPYLTAAAATWCVENNYHLAVDFLSPDPTPTANASPSDPSGFPAHERLLGADRLVFENLTGLDGLPDRFALRAYPLKIDADGAPVRAVAELD